MTATKQNSQPKICGKIGDFYKIYLSINESAGT